MTNLQHTRRSALGILATGPVAMLPALAVMSCGTKADAGTIGELPALIAKYHRAEARCVRFDEQVESPACKLFGDAVTALPHQTESDLHDRIGKLRTDFRIDEYDSHSEKLASYAWEAKWAAINYPVNSLAELCLKLDFIEKEASFNEEDAGLAVAADVRRLAGMTI